MGEAKGRKARLSKRTVDAIAPMTDRDVVVHDTELQGFRVRVRPSGRKVFEYRYRVLGRQRLCVIGEHGEVAADEALKTARALAGKVAAGADPQGEKADRRIADREALTVAEAARLYLAHGPTDKPDKRASSWERDRIGLERHVLPLLGKRRLDSLTPADLAKWQADVAAGRTATKAGQTRPRGRVRVSGGPGTAARAMLTLSAMIGWCISRDLATDNPAKRVRKLTIGGRERYLSEAEGAAVWAAVEALQDEGAISRAAADSFRLLALTGARRGEITGLRWPEVDLRRAILLLPPLRHKTGRTAKPKAVPLPAQAVAILTALPRTGEYVFAKADGSGPMEAPKRAWARIWKRAGVEGATAHTLRHTLASWAVADGVSLATVGKVLGHASPATTQRYAHFAQEAGAAVVEAVAGRFMAGAKAEAPANDAGSGRAEGGHG